ncbi:TPA: response regulator [Citrobacter freundii]|uniref:DNA-binding response regulator n=1 Tax=Klebsiella quasipneumoniae TaxID=1463165 RepID=A0AAI8IRF9_9ENTR|nr:MULTISPECIES: DNA-binding response regulator [Enterobacteriaceae]EBF7093817.1 response regulator transcription factor [Salmonella enterica subsp. enterica serovar Liverpool]HED1905549.1 response regulator [Citrobacter farmeri]AWL54872.1 DNA-binding response regulator [Klebsiella quasipneumoniae]AWL60796.1 DNA-binding response regulator [Klebsiella quasipneumoniae]AWL71952.1 DNA-binding response regulator [Klebsiella quasipneumoniae]
MTNPEKATVLVVDDDIDTISMLNDALDSAGFTVLIALDGVQALAITRQIIPHIILMDAMMPQLDGFETSVQLRQNPGLDQVPIIFMTGLNETEAVLNAFSAGVVDYVVKPVQLAELLARVRTHLRNSQLTSSAYRTLDSAGQLTCSINRQGEVIWATPGARLLLTPFCRTAFNLNATTSRLLLDWLDSHPEQGLPIQLKEASECLNWYLVHQTGPSHYVLRLDRPEKESDTIDSLRHHFSLTPREAEITFWLVKGKTNREIAQILTLSPRTVNKHLEQVFRKLEVDNRTSATARVMRCF